jgi:hypothetical protein
MLSTCIHRPIVFEGSDGSCDPGSLVALVAMGWSGDHCHDAGMLNSRMARGSLAAAPGVVTSALLPEAKGVSRISAICMLVSSSILLRLCVLCCSGVLEMATSNFAHTYSTVLTRLVVMDVEVTLRCITVASGLVCSF